MPKLEFISQLSESKLVRNANYTNKFTTRDVADFMFLYLNVLVILRQEFEYANFAEDYVQSILKYGSVDHYRISGNDLYFFGWMLWNDVELKDPKNSETLKKEISYTQEKFWRFLRALRHNRDNEYRRLLLEAENDLRIRVSNYRSIRRLVQEWTSTTDEQKKLVTTRLLQAFRIRAKRSELLPILESYAKQLKLEIKNAHNPEAPDDNLPAKEKRSFWTPFLAGGAAGYLLSKQKAKERRNKYKWLK